MKSQIYALDIGNTRVSLASFRGKCLQTSTRKSISYNQLPSFIKTLSKTPKTLLICSVVPKIDKKIGEIVKNNPNINLFFAGKDINIPIKHNYRSKKSLGMDRQINIYGASNLKKPPILIIDYGTAITFDYIDSKGVFQGGHIIPGPELSFQALIQKAALLPSKTRLPREKLSFFTGRSTKECLEAGILEGYGAMTDELINRFRKKYSKNLKVISTGGFAGHLKPYIKSQHSLDPDFTLKSIHHLYLSAL